MLLSISRQLESSYYHVTPLSVTLRNSSTSWSLTLQEVSTTACNASARCMHGRHTADSGCPLRLRENKARLTRQVVFCKAPVASHGELVK